MASVIRTLAESAPYRIDVLVTWAPDDSIPQRLRRAAVALYCVLARRTAPVVHVHLSERGSFVREGALVLAGRLARRRVAVTLHGATFGSWVGRASNRWLARRVLRAANIVFTLHDDDSELVRELAPGVRVQRVPNPVRARDGSPDEPVEGGTDVLFLGELSQRKGIDVLLKAWQQADLPAGARLLLAGPDAGPLGPIPEGVVRLGSVDAAAARRLVADAAFVVLPSRAEALPMTLLEAMSEARPFVGSRVAGIPALAASGGGITVGVGDVDELAGAISALLADEPRRRRMGQAAHEWYVANASPAAVHEALARGYRDTLPS
jgi:glycosyltransferase involved in cell wall biosynthesis